MDAMTARPRMIFNAEQAADELGMSRRQMIRYLTELGIVPSKLGSKLLYVLGRPDLERVAARWKIAKERRYG